MENPAPTRSGPLYNADSHGNACAAPHERRGNPSASSQGLLRRIMSSHCARVDQCTNLRVPMPWPEPHGACKARYSRGPFQMGGPRWPEQAFPGVTASCSMVEGFEEGLRIVADPESLYQSRRRLRFLVVDLGEGGCGHAVLPWCPRAVIVACTWWCNVSRIKLETRVQRVVLRTGVADQGGWR